jgi:hypothetical protein
MMLSFIRVCCKAPRRATRITTLQRTMGRKLPSSRSTRFPMLTTSFCTRFSCGRDVAVEGSVRVCWERVERLAAALGYEKITLSPWPLEQGYPEVKLIAWYKRHGYVERPDFLTELEKSIVA